MGLDLPIKRSIMVRADDLPDRSVLLTFFLWCLIDCSAALRSLRRHFINHKRRGKINTLTGGAKQRKEISPDRRAGVFRPPEGEILYFARFTTVMPCDQRGDVSEVGGAIMVFSFLARWPNCFHEVSPPPEAVSLPFRPGSENRSRDRFLEIRLPLHWRWHGSLPPVRWLH